MIASIGPHLKQLKVSGGEYILSQGEYANEIYFIKSGNVSLVIKKYNNFKFIYIEEGFYFGEVYSFFYLFIKKISNLIFTSNIIYFIPIKKCKFYNIFPLLPYF